MAFELITGHAGRNHVDSADMGEAFAGIVGKGRYILDTGDGMACSMTDSNTLTVGTGSMLMDGRIVRNETAATFKIANGTQGQHRHDLACLRYTLDRSNDSIESVEQVVLQGTPATTAGEAKDPEYEAGDILSGDLSATVPIARVKLDNLTPTCEAMLGSVTSLKSLGDSVSPIKVGSGSAMIHGCTVSVSVWYIPVIHALAVETKGSGYMSTSGPTAQDGTALTLESKYRPSRNRMVCLDSDAQLKFATSIRVNTNGTLTINVTASEPMRSYGWPETKVFIPL